MQGVCLIAKSPAEAFKSLSAFFRGNPLAQSLNSVDNFEPSSERGQIHDSSLAACTPFLPYS